MIDVFNITAPYAGLTTNASVYNISPFIDVNIFYFLLALSVIFLLASHVTKRGYGISGMLGFVFALAAMWTSMSIATVSLDIVQTNQTPYWIQAGSQVIVNYYEPTIISLAYPALTYLMYIYTIITFISMLLVLLDTQGREAIQEIKGRWEVK